MRRRVLGESLALAACVVALGAAGCARTPALAPTVAVAPPPAAPEPAPAVAPAPPVAPPAVAPPPAVTPPTVPSAPLVGPPPTPPGPTVLKKDAPVPPPVAPLSPAPVPPPRVLAPQVGGEEEARLSREVRTRLEGAEKAVGLIDQKRLGVPQLETYATIQSFLSKAREAVVARDYQRALTLADKAQTLATDLSRSATR